MKQGNSLPVWIWKSAGFFALLVGLPAWSQQASPPPAQQTESLTTAVHELQDQVRELRAAVVEVRSEAAQYRAETAELRKELQVTRSQLVSSGVPSQPNSYAGPSSAPANSRAGEESAKSVGTVEDRVDALEETTQLLNSKLNDQYQTKVESASKYRVRLSGLVLLNIFDNRGNVDNQDFPTWVTPGSGFSSSGALGASLRQSELGLEVFGPRLGGARTSGNLQVDFSGGFPNTLNGVNYGLLRLRIASMRMDWARTSIIAGQDNAFISPLSPTSFASLAVPTFGYAGNLWGWIPQVRVEHRFDISDGHNVTVQGGILDNLVGEPPYTSFNRDAQAGERSGQPAYGTRVAWTHNLFGRAMTLGAAGYYSRQDWGFNHHVDGWAGITDWDIPIAPRVNLSGEFYRGTAVGGLGGGVGRSVLFSGIPGPATQIRALDSIGGWSQLKLKASSRLEFNGAFGLDNPYAEDLRAFSAPISYFDPFLAQNRSGLVNFIYRPRSDLLFSAEYRHLRTFDLAAHSPTAEQVNLIMGFLF